MAEYKYKQLKDMTVAALRDIAKDIQPAIEGYSTMHKDHLLPAMCKALTSTSTTRPRPRRRPRSSR